MLFGPYPVDPDFTCGGVEKVMFSAVEGLKTLPGLELHVVSLSRVDSARTHRDGDLHIHHLPVQRRFSLPTFRHFSVQRARRAIRDIAPDLIHCQESGQEAYIVAPLPFPSLVTIHAVFHNERAHYPGLKSRLRYWQMDYMARRAVPGIDRYIPSSVYVCEELTALSHKLHDVVENPIEQRYFDVPDTPIPGRLLFAGTIYQRKGIEVLIAAADRLRAQGVDFKVHVAGSVGNAAYHEELQAQVERLALGDQVIFRGFLTEEELGREFSEADMVVLPSFAETSPMTVQQAMAAGKPVVATRVGGIPHLIEEGRSGLLVDSGDDEALAEALARLIADREARRDMGAAGKRDAEDRFSVNGVARRHFEIYERLLAGGFGS